MMKDAIEFQSLGCYCNLARVDVNLLDKSRIGDVTYITQYKGGPEDYIVAVSGGMVSMCQLVHGKSRPDDSFTVKKIGVILHSQEFQLNSGKMGMVLDFKQAKGDYYDAAMALTTRRGYPKSSFSNSQYCVGSFFLGISLCL